ncbi:type III-B CRISPR module-associated protein Cmr5 [Halorhodospira halophila]|uniref:CRISPR type III-B/RAMP module-associated protein Cmr5 n=1 Tax=Halorhodospira halophila (strain DSM 244 / SL1) TaxID=349124 RepID=A1WUQ3_HALHL|nr:type III-B CRISPR module-associated protein Cmr5 [Halorhodospira halophila]ABM61415.1 CRISPR-associated protein, Cmr5 family [Halorhodospira halophila SL1]MBK1728657.1 type III-B CRISPR module-associated protein Cmr5 [Halorhodospira halophila]
MTTPMTLEQQRAADAWQAAAACTDPYAKLAKGAPALIMNSGLMQTLAFLEDKGEDHHRALARQLRRWIVRQHPELLSTRGDSADPGYEAIMEALLHAEPRTFQAVTAEALAWLRWVRQIAPTRVEERSS